MDPYLAIGEPMVVGARRDRCGKRNLVLIPLFMGLGCALLWAHGPPGQYGAVMQPALTLAAAPASAMIASEHTPAGAIPMNGHSSLMSQMYKPTMTSRLGMGWLRGRSRMQAIKTQAEESGSAVGAEPKNIEDVLLSGLKIDQKSLGNLAGYDGPIVGASAWHSGNGGPRVNSALASTWHTGKDEPRSNAAWQDRLQEFKSLGLGSENGEIELPSESSRTSVIVNAVPKKRTSKPKKKKRRYANWYSKAEKQVERALNLARIAMARDE